MKITIFISSLSGGGAERVVSNLSNYLSKNHEITVMTMADETPAYHLESDIKTAPLYAGKSTNFLVKNIMRVRKLRQMLKKSNEDLYVVFLKVPAFLLLFYKHLMKAPIVVSERADPRRYFDHSKTRTFLKNWLYPRADGFVFQTDEAKDYYNGTVKNGIVIPNAINKEFVQEPFIGERDKKIVAAGRFTDQKNFSMLIKSFAKVVKDFPDYSLELYGQGPNENKLVQLTKDLGIESKVKFPGYVKDLNKEMVNASLFVLSSDFEGMPNALMEAMAMGVPSISTDCPVGGPRFLIDSGVNGLLVPVQDEEALTNAMSEVISNSEFAKKIGENARDITKKLDSDKIYQKWETYLTEIVNSKA